MNDGDESEDEWDIDSPDELIDDADWPKRTPDTLGAIEAQIAASPRRLLFLRGPSWYAWVDFKTLQWHGDPDAEVAVSILRDGSSSESIEEHSRTDEDLRVLYVNALSLMKASGIDAKIIG